MTKHIDITRQVLGLLGFSAVVTEIATLVERDAFVAGNFFAYFTVLSNVLAALFLIYYGSLSSKEQGSHRIQVIRGAATLYMVMTGIIFSLLLANIEGATLTAVPWDNIVLHYIMPIVMLVDWLLYPAGSYIRLRTVATWLVFPIVYSLYTILRGALVDWYPYPFFNHELSNWVQLIVTLVVMFAGSAAVGYGLLRLRNRSVS